MRTIPRVLGSMTSELAGGLVDIRLHVDDWEKIKEFMTPKDCEYCGKKSPAQSYVKNCGYCGAPLHG